MTMWAYSDDGPVSSALVTLRIVNASYPWVATTFNAAAVIRSMVMGGLRATDGESSPAGRAVLRGAESGATRITLA